MMNYLMLAVALAQQNADDGARRRSRESWQRRLDEELDAEPRRLIRDAYEIISTLGTREPCHADEAEWLRQARQYLGEK